MHERVCMCVLRIAHRMHTQAHLLRTVVEVEALGKAGGVRTALGSEGQGQEQGAQLLHHLVISHRGLHFKQGMPEAGNHEQALQRGVDVARVA